MNEINNLHSIYPDFDEDTDSFQSLYLYRLEEIYDDGLLEEYLEAIESDTETTGETIVAKNPAPVLV